MVILTFVRHGETDFNKNGILQGHLNIPLNSKGRSQAEEVGKQLARDTPINLIITSDLDRAYETATIIHDTISLSSTIPIISTQLLRERNLGKLEGVDLRQLVNWEELPEPKRLVEIQKLLSKPEVDLSNYNFKNENDHQNNNNNCIKNDHINNNNNDNSIPNDLEYTNSLASSTNSLSSVSSCSSSLSSSSDYDNRNSSSSSSPSSSLSSSTSSLTSVDIPISLTSSSTPTNVKLSSNILKLLPSRELKMESKSHLITRAKEAFQFILKQIPSKYINGSSVDSLSTNFLTNIFSSQSLSSPSSTLNSLPKDFHILIVSHSVMLRTILSLLLCKKPVPFFQSPNDRRVTQSEVSSIQNFKWIKCELKNASSIRTTFNVIEKKRDSIKRIPRDVVFYPSDSA